MAEPRPRRQKSSNESSDPSKVRLQRVLADAGVAARRVCEQMIEEGRVRVNGEVKKRLPVFVDPESDEIEVDGKRIPRPQRKVYIMLHKPAGTIVSTADEPGMERTTVVQLVDHPAAPRLFPVGRLDFDTTGLLLLTNDGELANKLTHPRYGVSKTYQALVKGEVDEAAASDLKKKIRAMNEMETGTGGRPPDITLIRREVGRTLLELTLEEGPSRQIREAFAFLGMPIKKLTRTAIGGVFLKGLGLAMWRELTRDEVQTLRKGGGGKPKPGARPRRAVRQVDRTARAPSRDRGAARSGRGKDQFSEENRTMRGGRAIPGARPGKGRPPRSGGSSGRRGGGR